jgi:hypothetical protein
MVVKKKRKAKPIKKKKWFYYYDNHDGFGQHKLIIKKEDSLVNEE